MIEPKLVEVDDYHEFDEIADHINLIMDKKVKCIELGFNINSGQYFGLIYQGEKPSNTVIKELRKLNDIVTER